MMSPLVFLFPLQKRDSPRLVPFLAQSPKRHRDDGRRHGKAQVTAP